MNKKAIAVLGALGITVGTIVANLPSEPRCACSSGKACERYVAPAPAFGIDGGWSPAPLGITLADGTWRGAGCVVKACVEIAGKSSWPKECPE